MNVEIISNGGWSADSIKIILEDSTELSYDWHQVDPSVLSEILQALGHEVIETDQPFSHDETIEVELFSEDDE